MSMKYSICHLILLFATLNIISKAEFPLFNWRTDFSIEDIEMEMNDIKSLDSALEFIKDFTLLYDQVYQAYQSSYQNMSQSGDFLHLLSQIDISSVCSRCQKVVELEQKIPLWREIQTIIGDHVIKSCLKQNYVLEYCSAMVQTYSNEIYNNIINKTLDPATTCAGLFLCPRESHRDSLKEYVKVVLADKPTTSPPVPTKTATYNVLHITDLHIDLEYQVGANKKCGEPLCCRAENGMASNPKDEAGYWGTVGSCDLPLKTFDQFLQFVANNFDIDMILWTGDNISHDIWHQNVENQTLNTYDATEDILKYFPNTFVYPMFGNHEAYPCDQFDMVDNTTSWLISRLADIWKVWLDETAVATFTNYSYYSIVNPVHNVKVIALDTQACDAKDFFLIQDPTDPFHQLEWLRKELYDSENKNQGVFIMGHIPPGDSTCDSQWSSRYRALVDRFTNTIRGQFFGHTHHDMFQVVRSYADNSPVGTAFIAASLTTDTNINPSFRIFEIDAETHIPINYYQYRLDLDKWNKKNTTKSIAWELAYNALDEYKLADLSPKSMNGLSDRIKTDNAVIKQYLANLKTVSVLHTNLTEKLIQNNFCSTHHSVYEDVLHCLGLNETTTAQLENLALQFLPGNWHYNL